ncbi:emp24/gp25L/p24 family/GOLD-domain-containing protein [Lipomyces japonicus]|uniref:emp24/gp25L/p24 family/GOLD-domain-containing protein n=1 Tax=Lipomyces japonicus TaxID=56871 RepID=UPI0034CE4295
MHSSMAFIAIALLALVSHVQGLYFYLEGSERKCFIEELPQDTLVVGYYNAEEFVPDSNTFNQPSTLGVQITVEEIFDNNHRVVNQRGAANGKFTFTAADSGEHKICFQTNVGGSGWFSRQTAKISLDIAIGETKVFDKTTTHTSEKITTLVEKAQELTQRLNDIKREQVFQREREAEFRDQSESTNGRVVKWSIIQLLVIGATCAWQLHHLRSFFVKQKLV